MKLNKIGLYSLPCNDGIKRWLNHAFIISRNYDKRYFTAFLLCLYIELPNEMKLYEKPQFRFPLNLLNDEAYNIFKIRLNTHKLKGLVRRNVTLPLHTEDLGYVRNKNMSHIVFNFLHTLFLKVNDALN